MKTIQKAFLTILITSFFSFTPSTSEIEEEIIGVWVLESHNENQAIYKKRYRFDRRKTGIEFKKDGTLIDRGFDGWCATVPTYDNFSGTWEKTSDSKISLKYDYWRGEIEADWLIVKVNKKKLKVKILDSEIVK